MPAFFAKDAQSGTNRAFHVVTDPGGSGDSMEVVSSKPHGTFGYAAGAATGVVDVPANALLTRVSVVNNVSTSTTVQIGLGAIITLPLGVDLDIPIVGDALNADVTIGGGAPQQYFVTWVVT